METFAVQPRDTTCRTLLHAAHEAFRRDLDRLAAAVAAGKGRAPHVRAGWDNLKEQIRLHHGREDGRLWRQVRRAVQGRRAEQAVLEEVRAEHARLDPLVTAVDEAMAGAGDLPSAVEALRRELDAHLRHEEMSALPLAETVLAEDEWRRLVAETGRDCESATPVFVPWVVDGIGPVERSRVLTALPPSLRNLNRVRWEPRYRKRRLWSI